MLLSRRIPTTLCVILCLCVPTLRMAAQEKKGESPAAPVDSSEAQDPLRVSVEEVRIPVAAYDERGRFDPMLEVADLIIREDDVEQQIKGVYRLPAYVLLLADTGGELNPVKNLRVTREVAGALLSGLRAEDKVAVVQVNNRVELVQDWTQAGTEAGKTVPGKLMSGKRSRLAEGLMSAVAHLQKTPAGNRHLVLVSDGLDSKGGQLDLGEAMKSLVASGIVVHVISYTSMGRKSHAPSPTRPREKNSLPDETIMSIPHTSKRPGDPTPDLRDVLEAKGGVTVDIDRLFRRGKGVKKEMARREEEFGVLAEETGGGLWLPDTAEEMLRQAVDVASEIDSQYVVTYKPQRPLSEAQASEYRRVEVFARRMGLLVKSRRGYVAKAAG